MILYSRSSTVHEKRRGRPKLAEAALKLDKLQEIEKLTTIINKFKIGVKKAGTDCIVSKCCAHFSAKPKFSDHDHSVDYGFF
jgi:hypothetical protein